MFDVKQVGDGLIAAIKQYVATAITREIEPLLITQRDLISRLDKQEKQLAEARKKLAALQRKD